MVVGERYGLIGLLPHKLLVKSNKNKKDILAPHQLLDPWLTNLGTGDGDGGGEDGEGLPPLDGLPRGTGLREFHDLMQSQKSNFTCSWDMIWEGLEPPGDILDRDGQRLVWGEKDNQLNLRW